MRLNMVIYTTRFNGFPGALHENILFSLLIFLVLKLPPPLQNTPPEADLR